MSTGGPFPERLHIIALVTDLYVRILDATLEWAEEAEATVARWRSTSDGGDPRPAIAARRRANRARLDG